MTDEKPLIDLLKEDERIKIDIPVEDETSGGAKAEHTADIGDEFKRLGRQFADTLEGIFNSDEARHFEKEVRAGMKTFADEVEKAFSQAKESPAATRLKEEAVDVKDRVEAGEYARKAQEGVISGLRWLSTELEKLADQFTVDKKEPTEKTPKE